MSTQDTAALVESVNKMTETVAGKIGEIDKKVEGLLGETSAVINSFLSLNIYVSASGNDGNTGSSSSPLATIAKAISIIPEGAAARIYLGSASDGSDSNVYDVVSHHDLGSRNVMIGVYGGSNVTLRFMQGGVFTTRSGGSLKIGNPHSLTIEVHENRSGENLVNMCGGAALFGGFYGTYLVNKSPALKSLCRLNFHVGDSGFGSTFGSASFMRFNLSQSTETNFVLCDVVLGGMMFISLYSTTLSGDMAIYNPARRALNIDSANAGLILTY
ncbi:hypothetical protein [Marinomonas sp. ef1]|uniref:hypothetical protein n=1 Tax=Marinomonas sp. ef1 TaxID=2005043 RepID=UPI000C282CD8|nr:hypothetical protein [Marinomonas sp. ef1]